MVNTNKELFYTIVCNNIKREGIAKLMEWLETTDFFEAPASTKYHGAHENGLLEHSLNVYKFYRQEMFLRGKMFSGISELDSETEESIAICALFHDICKANYYKTSYRNSKNSKGEWVKEPYYTIDNQLPMGHGEKSMWILLRFLKLTEEEAIAIRWHMGGFDNAVQGGCKDLSAAYSKYPSALLLHLADMKATYMLDN